MAREVLMDGTDKAIYNRVLDEIMDLLDDLAHTPPKYLQGNEIDVWHDALAMAYKELKKKRGGKNE